MNNITGMENRKITEKINQSKEQILNKTLARQNTEKKYVNYQHQRGDNTTDPMDTTRTIREY